ncbi:unnamed protein product, partial [Chrysoparadoxa australica]
MHPESEKFKPVELSGLALATVEGGKPREATTLELQIGLKGRHVRIFCRVWLINRSHMTLHYKESTLGGVFTSADPKVIHYGQPTSLGEKPALEGDGSLSATPSACSSPVPLPRATATPYSSGNAGVARLSHEGPGDRHDPGMLTLSVSMPFNHFQQIVLTLPRTADLAKVLSTLTEQPGLRDLLKDTSELSFIPWLPLSEADNQSCAELLQCELDRLSRVDGQLRALKSQFTGRDRSSALADYDRWHRVGFVMDQYTDPLPLDMTLGRLNTADLRLVHSSERHIAAQDVQLYSVQEKDKAVGSLGGLSMPWEAGATRSSKTRALRMDGKLPTIPVQLVDWGIALPFCPPSNIASITTTPAVLRCRASDSQWSTAFSATHKDILKDASISFKQERISGQSRELRRQYDLGRHVELGPGFLSCTTVITFLPRYTMVNGLNHNVEYTQSDCEGMWRNMLPSQESRPFHWPSGESPRRLRIRLLMGPELRATEWSGGFRVDALGDVTVKMRVPRGPGSDASGPSLCIVLVKVELVGATLLIRFLKQDPRWPPYRVDNLTSHGVRFRQCLPSLSISLPWDHLGPQSSRPYAWDEPVEQGRTLQLEFQQGNKWIPRQYRLDEFSQHKRVKLTRNLPDLSKPRMAGYLKQRVESGMKVTWRRRYCVLKGPVLYLFRGAAEKSSELDLSGVLYLGVTDLCSVELGSARGWTTVKQKSSAREAITGLFGQIGGAVDFLVGPEEPKPPQVTREPSAVTSVKRARTLGAASRLATALRLMTGDAMTTGPLSKEKWVDVISSLGLASANFADQLVRQLIAEGCLVLLGKRQSNVSSVGSDFLSSTLNASSVSSSEAPRPAPPSPRSPRSPRSPKSPRQHFRSHTGVPIGSPREIPASLPGRPASTKVDAATLRARHDEQTAVPQKHLQGEAAPVTPPRLRLRQAPPGRKESKDLGIAIPPPEAKDGAVQPPRVQASPRARGTHRPSISFSSPTRPPHTAHADAARHHNPPAPLYVFHPPDRDFDLQGIDQDTSLIQSDPGKLPHAAPQVDPSPDPSKAAEAAAAPSPCANLQGLLPNFVVEPSGSGHPHEFACESFHDMRAWIVALRDAVDSSMLDASVQSPSNGGSFPFLGVGGDEKGGSFLRPLLSRSGRDETLTVKTFVRARVRADGPTKVLELSEEGGEEDEAWDGDGEVQALENRAHSLFVTRASSVGVSLVDGSPKELVYLCLQSVSAGMTVTNQHQMLSLTVEHIQIDNQLPSTSLPALLRCRPIQAANDTDAANTIQLDGLAPRPVHSPPALHFYAKRL